MIPIIALIQSIYDFGGWFIWLGESISNWREYTWREWLFRIVKLILDFPVTIYVCLSLGISINTLILFYFLKWMGFCDLLYMIIRIVWTGEKMFSCANWFWWTPYGIWEYITGCKIITNYEFLAQIGIGFLITLILIII